MKQFIDISQFVLVLLGLMLCGLFATSVIGTLPLGEPMGFARLWTIFAAQNILAFILPALLTWYVCFKMQPFKAISADVAPSWKMIGVAVLLFIIGIPLLNQIVYWNQEMHLPESMSGFEEWCRNMEETANEMTSGLLDSTAIIPTITNIFIIGVLTGIGEEFFFRGALQRMLVTCRINPHIAIWTSAVIFSAAHFQFFGFVPRLLLGAFFGYLYWWSGSIWVNAFAHALNNSLVIISNWCINRGVISEDFDMLGVSYDSFPIIALISGIAVSCTIYYLYKSGILVSHRNMLPPLSLKDQEHATKSF